MTNYSEIITFQPKKEPGPADDISKNPSNNLNDKIEKLEKALTEEKEKNKSLLKENFKLQEKIDAISKLFDLGNKLLKQDDLKTFQFS